MKTILAPIDYSKASLNALNYAADFAMKAKAKLVLFHAYEIPLPMAEAPAMVIAPEVLEKDNPKKIEKVKKVIKKRVNNSIPVECLVHEGFAYAQILQAAKRTKADI